MSEFNADALIAAFDTNRYPTAEETIEANRTALYKHKKQFLEELKHSFYYIGFLVIVVAYLKDGSGMRFIMLCFLQYSISNPIPPHMALLYTEEHRTRVVKNMMFTVVAFFFFSLFIHLITKPPEEGDDSTPYRHGGIFIYFIGEKLLWNRFELVFYDVLIFFSQAVLHILISYTDASKVLDVSEAGTSANGIYQEIPDDGSSGKVFLVEVKVFETIFGVISNLD